MTKLKRFIGIVFLVICFTSLFAQDSSYVIKGVVLDEYDIPLPGATVYIKGTAIGTITNIDGYYTIDVAEHIDTCILVYSFVGYKNQEVPFYRKKQKIITDPNIDNNND